MKCTEYATLSKYNNIMMPTKKSDFDKKNSMESFTKCNPEQIKTCDKIGGKKCVIDVNNEAVCEIGTTYNYQQNMIKM